MSMNKKILAAAIVSGLLATTANAAVNISATAPVTAKIASELIIAGAGTTITNNANALDLQTTLGYAMSNGEVRYARVECASNIQFAAGSAVAYTDGGGTVGTVALGAINGLGTNAISFSVTSTAAGVGDNAGDIFTVNGNRVLTSNAGGSCTYGLYDQPSQAAAGGATGRIATTSGAYLASQSGYTFTSTAGGNATADVEAVPVYTNFVVVAGQVTATTARLAQLVFDVRAGTQADFDGTDITLADMFAATTSIKVDGDFSMTQSATGTYAGGDGRVFLAAAADCTGLKTNASTVSATSATFTVGATANANQYLCVQTLGTAPIAASTYTATLVATSATPASYNVLSTGPLAAGEIVRNGTELQAPLVQLPGNGWLSRMVLTNTGGTARPYTVSVLRETGSAGTTSNLTGTVPANGTVVVDLNTILPTFTAGAPRATLNVTIAGPNKQIQGLYQIVNANSLTISNHVMVRPGTN